ncbi:hypothetical protein HPG69_007266 [Diceros bicornis minor]|uniref:SCAN box domain-containing protein n=1 Tax=Diceros bicornis minor TaxID=77932 RepID=A0A7J7FN66_DICBM|nr:hypothetical protein HPG69_007266 [Diceros bicornis minor]
MENKPRQADEGKFPKECIIRLTRSVVEVEWPDRYLGLICPDFVLKQIPRVMRLQELNPGKLSLQEILLKMDLDLRNSFLCEPSKDDPGSENIDFKPSQGSALQKAEEISEFQNSQHSLFQNGKLQRLHKSFHLWLQPEKHSKSEISFQVVLEQFMTNRHCSDGSTLTEKWESSGRNLEKFMEDLSDDCMKPPGLVHIYICQQEPQEERTRGPPKILLWKQDKANEGSPDSRRMFCVNSFLGDEDKENGGNVSLKSCQVNDSITSQGNQTLSLLIIQEENCPGPEEGAVSLENPLSSRRAGLGTSRSQEASLKGPSFQDVLMEVEPGYLSRPDQLPLSVFPPTRALRETQHVCACVHSAYEGGGGAYFQNSYNFSEIFLHFSLMKDAEPHSIHSKDSTLQTCAWQVDNDAELPALSSHLRPTFTLTLHTLPLSTLSPQTELLQGSEAICELRTLVQVESRGAPGPRLLESAGTSTEAVKGTPVGAEPPPLAPESEFPLFTQWPESRLSHAAPAGLGEWRAASCPGAFPVRARELRACGGASNPTEVPVSQAPPGRASPALWAPGAKSPPPSGGEGPHPRPEVGRRPGPPAKSPHCPPEAESPLDALGAESQLFASEPKS